MLQPVYAGDVAMVMAASLGDPSTVGRTYELGGPRVYTLQQLVKFTAQTLGLRRWVFSLPAVASRLQAMILGLVPGKPFSLDNYQSLQVDNVTRQNSLSYFGIVPASIETLVPDYLNQSVRQKRLADFRARKNRS
jgi:NADH dehydrogenase